MSNVKHVLITGATGNVGVACDEVFTDANWETIKWSRRGGECVYAVDMTRWAAIGYQVERTKPVDLVIMAHGIQKPSLLENLDEKIWQDVMNANLTSSTALISYLIKLNKLKPDSLIVACSSIQANTPRQGRGAYAAAKAGLEALIKTTAMELAPTTRAVALRLGQLTETMRGIQFKPEDVTKLEQRTLLPWVDPYAIAKFCLALYEQKSLTGAVIDLDSGHGRNVWA